MNYKTLAATIACSFLLSPSADATDIDDALASEDLDDDELLLMMFEDIDDGRRHKLTERGFMYVSGKAKGVDGLVDPEDTSAIDATDTAFDMMLAGSVSLWAPDETTSIRVGANLFREDYVDYSEFDLMLLGATAQAERIVGSNLLKLQVGFSQVTLGGDDYLSYADLSLSDTIILSDAWDLRVSALWRDTTSDNVEYEHHAGNSYGIGFDLLGREDNPWRLDYLYRSNDAADDVVQFTNAAGDVLDGFLSYSRDYHRIRGRYEHNWTEKLSQTLTASWQQTEYHDPNLFLADPADTVLTETLRKGTRYFLATEISWSVNDRLRILGDIEFYDEESNIDQYDFDSLQIGIGLDYFF